ncbi:MAG TPA: sigma 54-interacting transcriptional regulator [Polyangiaceae bacterium]|jgi:DNA-binding NtrC family response regulator
MSEQDPTQRQSVDRALEPLSSYRVAVVDGPDAGKSLEVGAETPGRVLVGTSAVCGLVLTDGLVSRRHLALEAQEGILRAIDLGSTNGTVVNGVSILAAALRGGELVRVGGTTLRIDALGSPAPAALWPTESFGRVLGVSVAMRRLYPLFQKLSASALPLVVEGETGTGKELLAESLHELGPRKGGPFVVFDCAVHGEKQVEAALFGEDDPAAPRRPRGQALAPLRKGLFEEADGGTLLVDEVADLSPLLQAKLLRAVERGEFCRVRGDGWLRADVRIVATTRRDLDREVESGRFREDLFFRLAATRAELPPLRERAGDVPLLALHFWSEAAGPGRAPPPELLRAYEDYPWPGNVRELRHVVARKVALGDAEPGDTPSSGPEVHALTDRVLDLDLPFSQARAQVLAAFERRYVERVLAKHGGNVSRAAAASGIARRYFQILRTRRSS